MKLNDRKIRNAKPTDKPYKLTDGNGLFLLVHSNGAKYWRLKYRINGAEKLFAIGKYPIVSLAEAREAMKNAKNQIIRGIDPCEARKQQKEEQKAIVENSFFNIAMQWHRANISKWKPQHAERILANLDDDVFPHIGSKPIDGIAVADIKAIIERVAYRGAFVTAEKIRGWICAVFQFAIMLEKTEKNPALILRGFLAKPNTKHMPALPIDKLPDFFCRLMLADVERKNKIALVLLVLVFVRNKELRGGEWKEIDFNKKLWTIPPERMKRPREHKIPLSDWALELLQELQGITGDSRFLFPSRLAHDGYISEGTLGKIINGLGYKGIATPHGFRSVASSWLNKRGFNPDAIERQLAHIDDNKIRAVYNRADYMDERAEMMQQYSEFIREQHNLAKECLSNHKNTDF